MAEGARGGLSFQLALAQEGQVVSLVAGTSAGFHPHVRYPPLLRKRITPSAPRYRGGSFHRSGSHSPPDSWGGTAYM